MNSKPKQTKPTVITLNLLSDQDCQKIYVKLFVVLSSSKMKTNVNYPNEHLSSTARRILELLPSNMHDLFKMVEMLQCQENSPNLPPVTQTEVLNAIEFLKINCSAGHDRIPTKFMKQITEFLASPLCHMTNKCIQMHFQAKWKTTQIMTKYLFQDNQCFLKFLSILYKIRFFILQTKNDKVCRYKKGHSTVTALLGIRNMIVQAMGRGRLH